MKLLKTLAILLVIVTVFGGIMFALNFYTGPIIADNKIAAVKSKLIQAMPDAESFEDITATIKELPDSVVGVYKETSGKGYAVLCATSSKYTGANKMEIAVAVNNEGKISGIKLIQHSESLIFDDNYPSTYIDADSTLFGVELFAGSTFSSQAFKNAVQDAMNVLVENDLIKEAEKSPEQILEELIPNVAPELADAKKSEGKGDIVTEYKANGSAAYIVKDGETLYLAVVSEDGACKLYDVEGADVTADKADIVKKVTDYAASAANERLNAVLPDATGFEDITDTLTNLPASVVKVHKETGGLGYAIEIAAVGYNKEAPMDVVLGVSADGKIVEIKIFGYNDTPSYDMTKKDPNYLDSFKGKDSALADVGTVAGATVSSTGFKTAIAEAMEALVANNLVTAGVKSDAQILEELIPTVANGFTKLAEVEVSGNIQKAFKAENDTGFAYIMVEGDASYLAIVNAMGVCKIYNVEGAEVTAEHSALADEAVAASASQTGFAEALTTKLKLMMPDAENITAIELDTFNTVVAAVSFNVEGVNYYAFYSRSIGFHQMDVYFIIDENGAIVKMDAKQFIFEKEYFFGFAGLDESVYKQGFVGITTDTWTGEQAIIATATATSNAVKQSTNDAFDAFESIKGGEQ